MPIPKHYSCAALVDTKKIFAFAGLKKMRAATFPHTQRQTNTPIIHYQRHKFYKHEIAPDGYRVRTELRECDRCGTEREARPRSAQNRRAGRKADARG